MSLKKIKTTILLEPEIFEALRFISAETNRSMSELVNESLREYLREDAEDLRAFDERANEPTISYQTLLEDLNLK